MSAVKKASGIVTRRLALFPIQCHLILLPGDSPVIKGALKPLHRGGHQCILIDGHEMPSEGTCTFTPHRIPLQRLGNIILPNSFANLICHGRAVYESAKTSLYDELGSTCRFDPSQKAPQALSDWQVTELYADQPGTRGARNRLTIGTDFVNRCSKARQRSKDINVDFSRISLTSDRIRIRKVEKFCYSFIQCLDLRWKN